MGKIVAGPKDALFVIDMLKAFNQGGELPVTGIEGEISPEMQIDEIISLLDLPFGLRIFTGDEHPIDHIEHTIYGPHALAGTEGARMIGRIQKAYDELPLEGKLWYAKGQDRRLIGYSIEFSIYYGGLIGMLRERGFERIFFCGRAFTHCVGESAIDMKGQHTFDVCVIRDLSLSLPKPIGDAEKMVKKLEIMDINLVSYKDFNLD